MLKKNYIPLFLLGMCALINLYSTQPILGQLGAWAHIAPERAAWTVSATTLGVAICAPFSGAISDVYGRKRVMLCALGIMVLTTIACCFSPNFLMLLVLRLSQGLATPFVFTVAVAYISEEEEDSAQANGLYVAGTAFGGFAGRLLAGLVTDWTGVWRLSFAANAVILLLTIVTVIFLLPAEDNFKPASSVMESMSGIRAQMKDPSLLASCFIASCLLFQQVSSFTFGSLRLMDPPYDLSTSLVSFIFVIFLLPTVLTPFSGELISKNGRVFTFGVVASITILGLMLTLLPFLWAMVLGLAFSCVAVFMGQSCGTGFVSTHSKTNKSTAVGLYTSFYYLGGTLGAIVPEPAYQTWGWISIVVIIIVLAVCSFGVARRFWTDKSSI